LKRSEINKTRSARRWRIKSYLAILKKCRTSGG
jgi:hypothetical protein